MSVKHALWIGASLILAACDSTSGPSGRGARQPKRAAAGPCAPGGDYPDLPSLIATGELAYLVGEGETLPDPAAETGALVLESVSEAWPKSQVPACEGIDSPGSTIDWGLAADL